ncbi:hypothetical protein FXF51_02345 [Nonomuraea sp. PA05]|uniref:hypothetical protein n=1 Tax=Nonomuraea sp. PA05 TaxID=2604466 RepID=UPI0011D455E3|nr:hypothetical protein [Nonomuraea sp. PA05]TYB71294.1 hypothetical protein FXF51_02345 [Nonomuraea sp. PA05]
MRSLLIGLAAAGYFAAASCQPATQELTGVVIGSQGGDDINAADPYERPIVNVEDAHSQIWSVWVSPQERDACAEVNSPYPDCKKAARP